MQAVSVNLLAAMRATAHDYRDVLEVFAADYIPPAGGFDPADALETFSKVNLTWNGISYRRELKKRGDVSRFMGEQFNNVSLSFSNTDLYLSTFALNNNIQGMWSVLRRIRPSVTDDSTILFVGRFEEPTEVDKPDFDISAKQAIGSIAYEMPPRRFTLDDVTGRLPTDPLYEGFRFTPIQGTFQRPVIETKRFLFFFTKKKKKMVTEQYSSFSNTPIGEEIPLILGRVQLEGIPLVYADSGTRISFVMALSDGLDIGLDSIEDIRSQGNGFTQPGGVTIRLGEAGGTGTQVPGALFPASGNFSRTACVEAYVDGSSLDAVDSAPTITMVGFCKVPLPDAAGVYNSEGFSDNPVHLARFLITNPYLLNHPAALIDDVFNQQEVAWCDAALIDDSNSDRVFLPTEAAAEATAGLFRRWRSTARVDLHTYRHRLGLDPLGELVDPDYEAFNPTAPPGVVSVVRSYRKRWTFNAPVREAVKTIDYLYKQMRGAVPIYFLTNKAGRIQIKIERPADSFLLRAASTPGATEVAIEDVESWRTNTQGQALIGLGLITSEVRAVSSTRYSAAGNSITLAKTVTGTITATVSGATLAGGTDAIAPSATVTIGGTITAGNTVTVTIDGVAVVYTIASNDTTGTVAAGLRDAINANATLQRYVVASWLVASPTIVTIKSKLGFLTLFSSLQNAHDLLEEVIRVMYSFSDRASAQADCVRGNIRKGSFKWPGGNKEQRINQIKGSFRDARNDFAETPYEYNDTADQARIRKVLPLEIDLSGCDNLHQASRRARLEFSKRIEGRKLFSWGADFGEPELLEEGDVVCVSESSGGWINLPVRIEEMRIPEDRGPSFVARLYSTEMFSDDVDQHDVPLPTSLVERMANEGRTQITTTGGTTTLTAAQSNNGIIEVSGVLVSNAILVVPNTNRTWTVVNNTTGAFTVTLKTAAGTGATVTQGSQAAVAANSVNVLAVANSNLLESVTGTAPIVAGAIVAKSQAISIVAATTSVPGSMSAADKTKLDGVASAAQVNVLESVSGTAPIVAAAVSGKNQAISIVAATTSVPGSMSAADKTRLDAILASGIASLGSTFTLNTTSGTYQDTGLSITLPAAGTYVLHADVRWGLGYTGAGPSFIVAKLYNSTDSADVTDAVCMLVYMDGAAGETWQGVGSIEIPVTVAASKVIKLYANRNFSGTITTSQIGSDSNGKTRLTYLRVA